MYSIRRMAEKIIARLSSRMLVLVLALTVITASAAGGTLAWLYSDSRMVSNTFTVGDINISIQETDTGADNDADPNTNLYEMGVGTDIAKDPTVSVYAHSSDCWLYVQLDESENFAEFMEYAMADGWLVVADAPGVYCRPVNSSMEDQLFPVLKDNVVHMKADVTLEKLAELQNAADYPTLSITAFAVQRDSGVKDISTPDSAWQVMLASAE